MANYYIRSGDDFLRLPMSVREDKLTAGQSIQVVDLMHDALGAAFFRDKPLFLMCLEEQRAEMKEPLAFLPGVYLRVFVNTKGELRITSSNEVLEGSTVYAYDQFLTLVENIDKDKEVSLIKGISLSSDQADSDDGSLRLR